MEKRSKVGLAMLSLTVAGTMIGATPAQATCSTDQVFCGGQIGPDPYQKINDQFFKLHELFSKDSFSKIKIAPVPFEAILGKIDVLLKFSPTDIDNSAG